MNRIRIGLIGAAALAWSCAATAQTSWFPSKWGPNDEIGAANYMTPALALQAARLVKTGKVYSLGITVNTTTPAYPPRSCAIYIVQPGQTGSAEGLGDTHTTYNDDILNCWTGIGPNWTASATSGSATATTTATSGPSSRPWAA